MFGRCRGPIWRKDDFSQCFLSDYLEVAIPLLACAVSLVAIAIQWLVHAISQDGKSKAQYQQAPQRDDLDEDGDSDEETDSLSDLTLQKTVSRARHSIVDLDRPKAEIYVVSVELLALLAQVGLSAAELSSARHHLSSRRTRVAIAYLAVWSYIAILGGIRFYSSATRRSLSFPRLWTHTALLYGTQWLLYVWVFRTVLIHSVATSYRNITIAHFALNSLLLGIALCSRVGNRGVLLEYDGDIEPSREPLASPLSAATFGWVDAIVWQGFKRPLELEDVWNVALKDKAEIVLARFRQVKTTHNLALRLLGHFKGPILLQGAWCAMSSVFMFLPTLLLKAILEYLEDQSIPANAAWLYVILLFVTSAIQAVGDGQALWIGRKITIQLRAIIVGEIYSKTLRRKAAATAETELGQEVESPSSRLWKKLAHKWFGARIKKQDQTAGPNADKKKPADAMASNGTIINLMSIDSFKVADICAYLHFLWAAVPVQLIVAVALLYNILGYSSIVGVVLMALVLPLNMWIAKSFQRAQKRIMAATDKRIHATNEVLQNIRIIKYFAWEQRFKASVDEKRAVELSALWKKYILWSFAATIWSGVPVLITFISFLIYTLVEKKALVPSIAFPAISMFGLLRIPLDQLADMVAHIQESKVSVDRVEEFLGEEETEKYVQLRQTRRECEGETHIALKHATLTWGSTAANVSKGATEAFRLIDVDVEFQIGKLNVIAGPTGSGKTSLLLALLGEMKLLEGTVHIPGGSVRQDLRPDPETGLTESVAYCAQQPWLVNATIKDNILFSAPFDKQRYKAVISACALERDLEILDAGDQTLVGEKGITLSGGQKQRVSLARAIYSNSKHLLLDDCLSAVDSHTAKHIFEQALSGVLMLDRTCILVSHNVALTVPDAAFVVVLNNGKVSSKGTAVDVVASGAFGDDLKSRPGSRGASVAPSRMQSNRDLKARLAKDAQKLNGDADHLDHGVEEASRTDKQFVDTRIETKAVGSVKAKTIQMYLASMGPWYYWIPAAAAFLASQLGSMATDIWIRQWANAYHTSNAQIAYAHNFVHLKTYGLTHALGLQGTRFAGGISASRDVTASADDVDVGYYLGVYALLGIIYVAICLSRELVLFYGSLDASRKIHDRLLESILRAKFRFFDSTPLGQMTNRFSKDIQSVDQEVAPVAIGLIHSAVSVLSIVILISIITPGFLIPGFFIGLMYLATGMFYIRASRDLKRIESVQRSPLFQHFGETLSGVVTIRAYGDEARFMQDSHLRVNTHNRPFIYLWATNRWLAFRMDLAGALVSFFSGVFVVVNAGKIDAGAAGLALTYAIQFTQNVLWLVRLYASNEQNMNSVERIQEYIDVDQEAPARIPATAPGPDWPSKGGVEFSNYSTRYRSDLDQVLKKISFTIQPGEKVGVIHIDKVDIGQIGLQDLREAITIVPQDPTLFTGTLRSNLDPFELFTDAEVFTALQRVQLVSSVERARKTSTNNLGPKTSTNSLKPKTSTNTLNSPSQTLTFVAEGSSNSSEDGDSPNDSTISSGSTLAHVSTNSKDNKNIFLDLSTPIAESGSNLSQGQRQLLCLARALLKSPKILVMDEATASIDYATDTRIQSTLRELKEHTLITIAHRLQTIIDYDKILMLDKGR
ncbi:ATP-dependent bile acid permease [Cyphellophora attinorum]|uniref:ATP-dependent bile acid permease n=1 Tax=Cyphellophora attinorum TaxID=1664694 RepID=A0A0N1NWL4_9EURO|nr:ATP-dependent bile acid permease [Phialophora attinorum]KPI36996.1 ATP-dependent bile acid permease [Phialophora attinorum]